MFIRNLSDYEFIKKKISNASFCCGISCENLTVFYANSSVHREKCNFTTFLENSSRENRIKFQIRNVQSVRSRKIRRTHAIYSRAFLEITASALAQSAVAWPPIPRQRKTRALLRRVRFVDSAASRSQGFSRGSRVARAVFRTALGFVSIRK